MSSPLASSSPTNRSAAASNCELAAEPVGGAVQLQPGGVRPGAPSCPRRPRRRPCRRRRLRAVGGRGPRCPAGRRGSPGGRAGGAVSFEDFGVEVFAFAAADAVDEVGEVLLLRVVDGDAGGELLDVPAQRELPPGRLPSATPGKRLARPSCPWDRTCRSGSRPLPCRTRWSPSSSWRSTRPRSSKKSLGPPKSMTVNCVLGVWPWSCVCSRSGRRG